MTHCPNCHSFVTPGASDCAKCGHLFTKDQGKPTSNKKLYGLLALGLVVGVNLVTCKQREEKAGLTPSQCAAATTRGWLALRSDPTGPTHGMNEKEVEALASCYCGHLLASVSTAQLKLFAAGGEAAMADPKTRSAVEASMKACHPKLIGR